MLFKRNWLWFLLLLGIIGVNGLGLFAPILRNDDPVLYANIAKHIVLNHDWINLTSGGAPWLDKPHFPFWLAALSFKIFGINSFAYLVPGFLFHCLGLYYTYRLAAHLYTRETAIFAAIIYAASLHLMISAIDVRAEAYLLGQIMPACYYWLIYDQQYRPGALIVASLFTAAALMTKGLFVIIVIFGGLWVTWIYTRQWHKAVSRSWLIAYAVTGICLAPELICLYLQFDAHPEQVVFGQQHVSGLRWYFWGSQFGRFFNSGPITNSHGNPFYFVHTLLWAFLPWSLVWIIASYQQLRNFKQQNASSRAKQVYLWASFGLPLLLFSATKFQLDHYTNIILPFAAISCANYLTSHGVGVRLVKLQYFVAVILSLLLIVVSLWLARFSFFGICLSSAVIIAAYAWFQFQSKYTYAEQILITSVTAIAATYVMLLLINTLVYQPYDTGFQVARYLNQQLPAPVYDLHSDWLTLEFHLHHKYIPIQDSSQLPDAGQAYYLVMPEDAWQQLGYGIHRSDFHRLETICGNTIDKIVRNYANPERLKHSLTCLVVLKHEAIKLLPN